MDVMALISCGTFIIPQQIWMKEERVGLLNKLLVTVGLVLSTTCVVWKRFEQAKISRPIKNNII